ncbi:DUF4306 domain-containing protein [Metabacillus fastidiosus]|uniref:DUF4306 domain-containing protein n=1 Tax=Metabacillus fastidiosus TaxID=1458 RepID=UPI002DB602E2|nr:DUF4306 domain-containing protein [Metabacillus fastidiosus]MEC2077566.1 DUF4306 domain-containing protein [Metabacillus fastidiosus]
MKIHYFIQIGAVLMLLLFSTFFAWYEGSALLESKYEWKYTAKFTYWLKGEPTSHKDILQLDYFIYAAKFRPFFIYLMIFSFSYLFIISFITVYKYRTLKG